MNQEFSNLPGAGADQNQPGLNPIDLMWFALAAARRHWKLSVLVALGVAIPGIVIARAVPAVYDSSSKIYASRNALLTTELAAGRRTQEDDQKATRGLTETVYKHDNLVSIVREAKLVETWPKTRTWPLRLKDQLQEALLGPLSHEDQERIMLRTLQNSLYVGPEETGSIRFRAEWRDPHIAYTLVMLAERNFLQARRTEELAAITRATTLLEEELRRTDSLIEPAVREVQTTLAKLRDKLPKEAGSPRPVAQQAPNPGQPALRPGPSAASLKRPVEITSKLEEIRREQRELLEPWQRRAAEARFQLAELRATYGPEHPLVRAQEAKVKTASEEPLELSELKSREASLMASLTAVALEEGETAASLQRRIRPSLPSGPHATSAAEAELESLRAMIEREIEDPELSAARIRLEGITRKSQELRSRLDSASMELATAQAGFKYRYSVIEPPELVSKPIKPNRPRLYLMVLAAAILLGLLTGGIRDLLGGRVLESWQIRRYGVETLAEVDLREWHPRRR